MKFASIPPILWTTVISRLLLGGRFGQETVIHHTLAMATAVILAGNLARMIASIHGKATQMNLEQKTPKSEKPCACWYKGFKHLQIASTKKEWSQG